MAQIVPYINFPGNTREAMNFYKDCLGGDVQFMTFGGSPIEEHMPQAPKDGIVHSELTSGSFRLMASDMVSAAELTSGNNMSIMIDCDSEEQIRSYYDKLSAGGNPDHPVQPAFWGGLFGHLIDKFGIVWLLNCSPKG